ncbi:MAG: phosphoserine transaminase [Actinobacteria bacterium]|nr:phosphoserine transaminase [Actinomycetota bacterium]
MPDHVSSIPLPAELLPSDGRFGSGPSKVRTEAVRRLADAAPAYLGTSHRRDGVRSVVGRVRRGLSDLFGLPDGYEVLLGNGGTTAFWDAAIFSLIDQRSEHLAFGEFSSKFADAARAAPHLDDPVVIESEPGTHPQPVVDDSVDLYALTQNETSTGVTMPVRRPDGATGALMAVDATSAAGGIPVDPTQFDVYYFAPQKCFGGDGGLWLACCSPAAVERISTIKGSGRWSPPSLDLTIALENSRLDQTYNTPALATLFLLADQVEWMLGNGGLEWTAARCEQSAAQLYGWAEASDYAAPFVADPLMRSPVTATVDLAESISADSISAALRENGIVDTESYRKLGRNQLRIAMFPNIEPDDVARLTAAIDYIVERLPD